MMTKREWSWLDALAPDGNEYCPSYCPLRTIWRGKRCACLQLHPLGNSSGAS